MKTCTKCKIEKPFEAFYKQSKAKDGHCFECKECYIKRKEELKKSPLLQLERQIRSSIILENKLLRREGKRLCGKCNEIFLIDDLKRGYCEKCSIEHSKEYYQKNKDKITIEQKEYQRENKDKIRENRREYCKEYQQKNKYKINEYNRQYRLKKKLEKEN